MNLFNAVMKSNLLTSGCKLYYTKLFNRNKSSKGNNWKITSGKYENYNFILARDEEMSGEINVCLTSIYKYKKTLKELGLIATLPKCTTRTNQCKNKHYRQLTVVIDTLPKKFIGKMLTFNSSIKKARILKTPITIISQIKKSLNNTVKNINAKIENIVNTVKTSSHKNTASIGNLNLNKEDVQTVCNTLNTYNISFKNYEIKAYLDLYKKSKEKFTQTCKYCSDKHMYAPLKYFTKVFESSKIYINKFSNFPQREYDYEKLEKLLVANNYDYFS